MTIESHGDGHVLEDPRLTQAAEQIASSQYKAAAKILSQVARDIDNVATAKRIQELAQAIETQASGQTKRQGAQLAFRATTALQRLGYRKQATEQERRIAELYKNPLVVLPRCFVVGGHGLPLTAGETCELVFKEDALRIADLSKTERTSVAYEEVIAIEVGGPGARRTGGGYSEAGLAWQARPRACLSPRRSTG